MEEKRSEFLQLIEDWERVYGNALLELGAILSFVESLQPSYVAPSTSIVELYDQTNNPDLESYMNRGCQKALNSMGWNEAYQASNAYRRLVANKETLICLKSKLRSLVEDSLASIEHLSGTSVNWRILDQGGPSSSSSLSAFDVLLLMAAKLDNVEKECQLLVTVVDSVSIFSRVAELKAQMIVLKLRPYEEEQTTERLKNMEATFQETNHIHQ